jgi:hypothetical protein
MKSNSNGPLKKMEDDKNDATASFPNAEKPSAAEVNNSYGNKKSKNYMEGDDDVNGPNFDKDSEGADGDTTVNAGIFK